MTEITPSNQDWLRNILSHFPLELMDGTSHNGFQAGDYVTIKKMSFKDSGGTIVAFTTGKDSTLGTPTAVIRKPDNGLWIEHTEFLKKRSL